MKTRVYDVFVYDINDGCTALCKTCLKEEDAKDTVTYLEAIGINSCYGIRPDRIVNGKCVYDED